ncbi:hypothetical protein HMPREF0580_1028 [Mobiluncus mulieris ATCC 35239]|uniref:Uncharacterized protein n=1 Tax=Mobiluncus mulieris ATCC 35239 TaxID=871571 RepID=E0QPR1_9ACTO|nr:hypothetical protein HMPREF0580_1028 [Mobiluncus mulieris ATCC 35239]
MIPWWFGFLPASWLGAKNGYKITFLTCGLKIFGTLAPGN